MQAEHFQKLMQKAADFGGGRLPAEVQKRPIFETFGRWHRGGGCVGCKLWIPGGFSQDPDLILWYGGENEDGEPIITDDLDKAKIFGVTEQRKAQGCADIVEKAIREHLKVNAA